MGRGTGTTREAVPARTRAGTGARLRPDPVRDRLYANLNRLGLDAWDCGGGPRDDELGQPVNDRDFAVSGMSLGDLRAVLEAEAKACGGKVTPLEIVTDRGRQHSGYRISAPWTDPEGIEIMLAREEISTGLRHQDFEITPIPAELIDELMAQGMTRDQAHREVMRRDAVRRDRTVNQIMRNVRTGETLDFFGGVQDLRDRVLRPISPDTCRDDPMRTLRGITRMSKDGLVALPEAEQQIRENAHRLAHLTQDKIFKELDKTLKGRHVRPALLFACETGALQHALPEFAPSVGYDQMNPYHPLLLHEHEILAVQRAVDLDAPMPVRWAALMHDIGKAHMGWSLPGENRRRFNRKAGAGMFDPARFGHEEWSVELAREGFERMECGNEFMSETLPLIEHHMFTDDRDFEQRNELRQRLVARQFIARVAADRLRDRQAATRLVENLLTLRYCDHAAKDPDAPTRRAETPFERVVRDELANCPLHKSHLTLKGGELIKAGLKPGPVLTEIEQELLHRIQASDDPVTASRRSGADLAEVIAARGDVERFRSYPFIERWAADAVIKAQRRLQHADTER